ncbi:class I SAM-dependent methyltransferase [Sphingomonas psychrotolerans]|uniref:class I SAM-dependent methyltransferase n=1 Tax=Sphingomonas psychrotolerans TaxID=1327635 RepID=UPI0018F6AEE3|nr:class I SAM-dependent methyltransferase [Sphingomonas psychrotolerans]
MNPFFLARRALRREIATLAAQCSGRLLDVGCGSKPYRSLFSTPDYIGLEIDSPMTRTRGFADAFYDGHRFPFDDASFETVLCNQVLEHVFNPEEFVREIARVLKPGGKLLLTVPFVWDEHEQPYDFARYSSFGLRDLLSRQGLDVATHRKTLPNLGLLGQLAGAYFYKIAWKHGTVARALAMGALIAPSSLVGWLLGAILPNNLDLYLDNVVLANRA